ncbi:MAG: phospholipase D-like domain-containing protein [Burkholderiaceae bacterium]
MSVLSQNGLVEVFLTPPARGATDDLRQQLEAILSRQAHYDIASQQMADRGIVMALADLRAVRERRARVFVESRYLTEADPLSPDQIWDPGGDRESNRQCFAALSRAGIEVRADVVGGALQHVNLILAHGETDRVLFLTSANLAPGSIDKHLNWAVKISSPNVVDAVATLFDAIWDGDFRDATVRFAFQGSAGRFGSLAAGAGGEAIDEAIVAITGARERIRFAYFTMTADTRIVNALVAAANRGVDVAGIVDADQGAQFWNAVPQLRDGGVDARYYPGALTGASGRMHHKTIVIDHSLTYLATANASKAAEDSFEISVTFSDTQIARFVDAEILRLGANASTQPIGLL